MKQKKVTFRKLVYLLKDLDSPLGDLCYDITRDTDFPIDGNDAQIFYYLSCKREANGEHLTEPIRKLKAIWNIINL